MNEKNEMSKTIQDMRLSIRKITAKNVELQSQMEDTKYQLQALKNSDQSKESDETKLLLEDALQLKDQLFSKVSSAPASPLLYSYSFNT